MADARTTIETLARRRLPPEVEERQGEWDALVDVAKAADEFVRHVGEDVYGALEDALDRLAETVGE